MTGHDPASGSDHEVFRSRGWSRVGSGRDRNMTDGSGQEVFEISHYHRSRRVALTRPGPREIIRPIYGPALSISSFGPFYPFFLCSMGATEWCGGKSDDERPRS